MPDSKVKIQKIQTIPTMQIGTGKIAKAKMDPLTLEMMKQSEAMNKLKTHLSILKAAGVPDLEDAGTASLTGIVFPSKGIFYPGLLKNEALKQFDGKILDARIANGQGKFRKIPRNRKAMRLPSVQPFTQKSLFFSFTIPYAYIYADVLDLQANTKILLESHLSNLVIIANKIIARSGTLDITWNKPAQAPAEAQISPPTSNAPGGVQGIDGADGNDGKLGINAPNVEIWVNEGIHVDDNDTLLTTPLNINLSGQAGQNGQRGQAGQKGGKGAKGDDSHDHRKWGVSYNCASGPKSGKNGARGGRGGDGGTGGNGGNAGNLDIFITDVDRRDFFEETNFDNNLGGEPGKGGFIGRGGPGGDGGRRGHASGMCANTNWERKGRVHGKSGPRGISGTSGEPGDHGLNGTLTVTVIPVADFNSKVNSPGIAELLPEKGPIGSQLQIKGTNFAPGDTFNIGGQLMSPNPIAGSPWQTLTIQVPPSLPGGAAAIEISNSSGSSNNVDFLVTPRISNLSATKIRPGETLTINGTGFSPTNTVRFDGQTAPNVTFIDDKTLEVIAYRPTNVSPNPAGEDVMIQVADEFGNLSNGQSLRLKTLRVLYCGDSIKHGQALGPSQKHTTLVTNFIRQSNPEIGVYPSKLAQSGALLVRPLSTDPIDCDAKDINPDTGDVIDADPTEASMDPEIPRPFPSTRQQLQQLVSNDSDMNENVELIVITSGIRNVGVFNTVDPLQPLQEKLNLLAARSNTYCFQAMRDVLIETGNNFPNARIIVTGYFPIFSQQSSLFDNAAMAAATLLALSVSGPIVPEMKNKIVQQCQFASDIMDTDFTRAVNEANLTFGSNRVQFVSPNFEPRHSLFAPDSLVFGLDDILAPEDSFAVHRRNVCPVDRNNATATAGGFLCSHASVGHPNIQGAQRYANAIIAAL